jgi:azurin
LTLVSVLACLLAACSATINGASVTPVDASKCVGAALNKEDCTIHFAKDDKLEFSTKEINVTVADIPADAQTGITFGNLSPATRHTVAVVSGEESCPKQIADAGKDSADTNYVPNEIPAGCSVLITFDLEPGKATQLTAGPNTPAGTYYFFVTTPGAVDAGMVGKMNVK